MATEGVRQELKAAHATSPFTIVLVADGSPVLEIAATDASPAAATNTASVLVKVAGTELEKLQVMQNVPKNAMIGASQLISPTEPDVLHGSQTQALLGVVALGLILSVTVCFAAEGAFTGRGAALAAAVRGRRATGSRGAAGSKGATRSPGDSRRSAPPARAGGVADRAEDDGDDGDDDEEQGPAQPRDTRGTTMVLVGRRRRSEE